MLRGLYITTVVFFLKKKKNITTVVVNPENVEEYIVLRFLIIKKR